MPAVEDDTINLCSLAANEVRESSAPMSQAKSSASCSGYSTVPMVAGRDFHVRVQIKHGDFIGNPPYIESRRGTGFGLVFPATRAATLGQRQAGAAETNCSIPIPVVNGVGALAVDVRNLVPVEEQVVLADFRCVEADFLVAIAGVERPNIDAVQPSFEPADITALPKGPGLRSRYS